MSHHLVVVGDCACPVEIAEFVSVIMQRTHSKPNSLYRGDDALALLHRYGKHTQRELYNGYNSSPRPSWAKYPANPPDKGSHILLGDAIFGKLHEPLDPRSCGQDWNDELIPQILKLGSVLGWDLVQLYKTGSEYHHVCAVSWPALGAVLDMRRGDNRGSVGDLTRRLAYVGVLDHDYVHTVFNSHVETGVKKFQQRAKLRDDGVVGPTTWKKLDQSVRRKKAKK